MPKFSPFLFDRNINTSVFFNISDSFKVTFYPHIYYSLIKDTDIFGFVCHKTINSSEFFDIFDRTLARSLIMEILMTLANKQARMKITPKLFLRAGDLTPKIWVTGVKITPKNQFTGVIYRSYHSHSCHFDIPRCRIGIHFSLLYARCDTVSWSDWIF